MDITSYLAFGAIGWIIVMTLLFFVATYNLNNNIKRFGLALKDNNNVLRQDVQDSIKNQKPENVERDNRIESAVDEAKQAFAVLKSNIETLKSGLNNVQNDVEELKKHVQTLNELN